MILPDRDILAEVAADRLVRTDRLGLPVEYVPCPLRIDGPEDDEVTDEP